MTSLGMELCILHFGLFPAMTYVVSLSPEPGRTQPAPSSFCSTCGLVLSEYQAPFLLTPFSASGGLSGQGAPSSSAGFGAQGQFPRLALRWGIGQAWGQPGLTPGLPAEGGPSGTEGLGRWSGMSSRPPGVCRAGLSVAQLPSGGQGQVLWGTGGPAGHRVSPEGFGH